MTRNPCAFVRTLVATLSLLHLVAAPDSALAGPPRRRVRRTVAVSRVEPCPAPRATSTLGTFFPTPYITVRGNLPVGGGYSPLESYGDQTLALYGPLSLFRTTAPVLGYVRGYDGQIRVTEIEAASFSDPDLHFLSPVPYPAEGNYYYGPRVVRPMP